jgi:hypothetical protein
VGVPNKAQARHRPHVDTDVLRFALEADEDEDLIRAAKQLVRGEPRPRVCISGPALGELTLTLLRDDEQEHSGKWSFGLVMERLQRYHDDGYMDIFPLGKRDDGVARLAAELMTGSTMWAGDPDLNPMDALIVACCLKDDIASGIHTTDSRIILSPSVQAACKHYGKEVFQLRSEGADAKRRRGKHY